MKPLHVVILTSLLAGCSSAHRDYEWHFIQGKIRIVPPVTRNLGPPAIGDGGTLQVHINDSVGKEFIIFIDHRIESPTPGAIFTKTGFFAIGSRNRAARVSSVDDRVLRAIPVSALLTGVSRRVSRRRAETTIYERIQKGKLNKRPCGYP